MPVTGTTKVAKAATTVAKEVATEAGEAAEAAAPKLAAVTKSTALKTTGWLTMLAGAAGLLVTAREQWEQAVGKQQGFAPGEMFNPSTGAIGLGALMMTVGDKLVANSAFMRTGMRAGGAALVLGGVTGAIIGAMNTYDTPLRKRIDANTQNQEPVRYPPSLPPAPANLEGVKVASAAVVTGERTPTEVPVYVDPRQAKQLPPGTDLAEAIGHARAALQEDQTQQRSHAVIKTKDGAISRFWVVPLSGDLDQVDGRKFTDGNDFNAKFQPVIGRRQAAIQAIAGADSYYAFPKGTDQIEPVQYVGDIPWITPNLPGSTPKPSPSASPKPTTSPRPATSATPTPTPAASAAEEPTEAES